MTTTASKAYLSNGRPGGDVEAFAVGFRAVELEGRIRFDEVVMAAHLNGAIAEVGDFEGDGLAVLVERDFAGQNVIGAGDNFSFR